MAKINAVEQRGLVVMSALLNFVDWLDNSKGVIHLPEKERGALIVEFLESHSEGENYFKQAEEIAERLSGPFKKEQW